MKNTLLLGLLSVALAGCVGSNPVRTEYADEITRQGLASLQFSRNTSASFNGPSSCSFVVESVSGPKSSRNAPATAKSYLIAIEPGVNTVKTRVNDFISIMGGNRQRVGYAEITFIAAPSTAYTLCGFSAGEKTTVWIAERNTLRKITGEFEIMMSPEVEEPYPAPPLLIIPIPK